MIYKTLDDVRQVIDLRKHAEVVDLFITSYLTGMALAPVLDAEAEYAELQAQPDQQDEAPVLDEDGVTVLVDGYSPNAIRDALIAELEATWPHLVDPEDGNTVEARRPNPDLDIDQARQLKLIQIKSDFEAALPVGQVDLSLGWAIDCRRSSKAEDVSNMERLLKLCQSSGMADTDNVQIRGTDNLDHLTTVAGLRDVIIPEMYQYGLGLYQKKWTLEATIASASSVQDVLSVRW